MRKYSSTIPAMTLNGSLSAGATSATITGANNLPVIASPNVLTLVIEPDTANEEIVTVTAHGSGSTSVTIVRGQESTSDIAHSSAVAVKHMVTARDLAEPHQHIVSANYSDNGSVELHGLGTSDGNVVGTSKAQTLTNKTISGSSNTLSNIAQASVTNLVSDLAAKATLASPTFTGTVVLPSTTSIGTVLAAEIAFVDGVTSSIQTQLDAKASTANLDLKAPLANPAFTDNVYFYQPNPTAAKSANATLTIAELLTGYIQTSYSGVSPTFTLPTGTLTDAGILSGTLPINAAFDWSVQGIGGGTVTIAGGSGHTVLGTTSTITSASAAGRFRTRKTATNTYVTYRIA